jgi:hypothetical protein
MLRGVLLALGVLVLMGGSFGAGFVVSPMLTPASVWDRQALRVDGADSGSALNARLRAGWEIERQDADGRGTTYVLRRDSRVPTPTAQPTSTPRPTSTPDPTWRMPYQAEQLARGLRVLADLPNNSYSVQNAEDAYRVLRLEVDATTINSHPVVLRLRELLPAVRTAIDRRDSVALVRLSAQLEQVK